MNTIALTAFLLAAAAVESILLARRRMWGELAVSLLFWIAATVYSAVLAWPLRLINPTQVLVSIRDLFLR